jgi:hypothetical protein
MATTPRATASTVAARAITTAKRRDAEPAGGWTAVFGPVGCWDIGIEHMHYSQHLE